MTQRLKKLLHRVRDAARLKQYANRRVKTCVYWAKRFLLCHEKRHPLDMREQISQAFTFLPVAENVPASTQNQGLSAARHLC